MSRRRRTTAMAAPLILVVAGWVTGQTQPAPEAGAAAPADPDRLQGSFRNGFILQTEDGANSLRVAASFHLDLRTFGGDSVAPTSFDIRRARLDLRGKLRGWMTYRLQAALENEPYIRNRKVDNELSAALRLIFRF